MCGLFWGVLLITPIIQLLEISPAEGCEGGKHLLTGCSASRNTKYGSALCLFLDALDVAARKKLVHPSANNFNKQMSHQIITFTVLNLCAPDYKNPQYSMSKSARVNFGFHQASP